MAAFDLSQPETFEARVEAPIVGDFTIELKRPTVGEQIKNMVLNDSEAIGLDRLRFVVGWSNVTDAAGQPIPFSWDNLLKVCRYYPQAATEIFVALSDLFVIAKGRRKNSEGRLDTPPSVEAAATGQSS